MPSQKWNKVNKSHALFKAIHSLLISLKLGKGSHNLTTALSQGYGESGTAYGGQIHTKSWRFQVFGICI